MTTPLVHKATPADPEAPLTSCTVCKEPVRRVPIGNGATVDERTRWVHDGTGCVAGSGGVKVKTTEQMTEIVALLKERLPDIPLHETAEGGRWHEGINVYRFTRPDLPSSTYPYKGTRIAVMYAPEQESETRQPDWIARVREVLLPEFGDRYRPLAHNANILIEDADTRYSRERKTEYAHRANLGFPALHEMGK